MVNSWIFYALSSAAFASLTAIFGKIGVSGFPSNFATLLRTIVIFFFTLAIVLWRGEWQSLAVTSTKSLAFLVLSGLATGASWLCYYRALQIGEVSRVAPVDKLSVPLTLLLAFLLLGETLTWKTILGGFLIFAGTLVVIF